MGAATETTTDTGTGTTTTPPATGAGAAPPKTETKNEDPEGLGEAGLKALRAERARADEAERKRIAAETERDELRSKNQTAEEKAIEAAKKAGREEATLEANRRIARSEIKAAAGGKLQDAEDAASFLGDLDRFIVKGEVDSKAITSAIDELVKAKPYLAAAGKGRPLPGGGATQSSGTSFNDTLRRKIRGG
jgi:hypothetical protein